MLHTVFIIPLRAGSEIRDFSITCFVSVRYSVQVALYLFVCALPFNSETMVAVTVCAIAPRFG